MFHFSLVHGKNVELSHGVDSLTGQLVDPDSIQLLRPGFEVMERQNALIPVLLMGLEDQCG